MRQFSTDWKPEYDFYNLRQAIKCKYRTESCFAEKIGIKKQQFSLRLQGKIRFRVDEIKIMCELLDISENEIQYYFRQPYIENKPLAYQELRDYIKKMYRQEQDFALAIGLSKTSLSKRFNHKVKFTKADVKNMAFALNSTSQKIYSLIKKENDRWEN